MNERKRKVGRPNKNPADYPIKVTTTVSSEIKSMINSSFYSMREVLEYGARMLLGDSDHKRLVEIEQRLSVIEPEVLALREQKKAIEERMETKVETEVKK